MNRFILCGALLLSLFAASCSNDSDNDGCANNSTTGKTPVTVTAGIQNEEDSRIVYEDNNVNSVKAIWSVNESFTMYNGTSASGETFSKTTEGDTFSGIKPDGNDIYYSVYSNNAVVNNTDGTLSVSIANQDGTASEKKITEFMIAQSDDLKDALQFKHKLTVLKITLYFPDYAEGTVSSIKVSGLHNSAKYSLKNGVYTYSDAGDITATNGNDGFTVTDNAVTAYISVFPETVQPNSVTISATLGADTYFYTLKSGKTLNEGKVTPIRVHPKSNTINGHEYVDLGLSVLWATCNIGSSDIYSKGNTFAWGETETKTEYSWENYLTGISTSDDCGTAKDPMRSFVYPNKNNIAGSEYDAAHVNWKGGWKIPTGEQFAELCDRANCSWDVGFAGEGMYYIVTSKKEGYKGNFIIIPASTENSTENYMYTYWTSMPYEEDKTYAYAYYSFGTADFHMKTASRHAGNFIRPVHKVIKAEADEELPVVGYYETVWE